MTIKKLLEKSADALDTFTPLKFLEYYDIDCKKVAAYLRILKDKPILLFDQTPDSKILEAFEHVQNCYRGRKRSSYNLEQQEDLAYWAMDLLRDHFFKGVSFRDKDWWKRDV